MAKTVNTIKNEYKFLGVTLFEIVQTFYEISTENETPSISDEVILHERIARLKEKEKKNRFK